MKRELHIGQTYYAFYYDPAHNVCYAGLVYYAGKGMCVNYLGYDMLKNTLPIHYSMLMPKDQCESPDGRTITEFKSQPYEWNIDSPNVEVKDIQSPWLPDYTWWKAYIEHYDLKID